jgi:DNA-directed RNA polymerase subunit RPC12/RpoP
MDTLTLDGHSGIKLNVDICSPCHAFWFDARESLQLAPAGTLHLFGLIGETTGSRSPLAAILRCPRCTGRLLMTRDLQRNTAFRYWRCARGHGRFITFFDFLREKDFIRPLTAKQIDELRQNVQFVNCSNCGAPVDLAKGSACAHCGTPLSMLDSKQAQTVVDQLKRAAEPRPIDPALPLELARARREVELMFADVNWSKDVASLGLVEVGFSALMNWLKGR